MDTQALLERVEKLERSNRRMKRAGAGLAALAVAAVLAGAAAPKTKAAAVVRAQRFELVGADGSDRGAFLTLDGNPGLILLGGGGKVIVAADAEGGRISIHDKAGEVRALVAHGEGDKSLVAVGQMGGRGARLSSGPGPGGTGMSVTGDAAKSGATVLLAEDGLPSVSLFDRGGKVRANLSLNEVLGSSLSLADYTGKPRLGLSVRADGTVFADRMPE